jgi:hypothetical protein
MVNREIPQLEIQVFLLEKELKELRNELQTFQAIMLKMHDVNSVQYLIMKNHVEKGTV